MVIVWRSWMGLFFTNYYSTSVTLTVVSNRLQALERTRVSPLAVDLLSTLQTLASHHSRPAATPRCRERTDAPRVRPSIPEHSGM